MFLNVWLVTFATYSLNPIPGMSEEQSVRAGWAFSILVQLITFIFKTEALWLLKWGTVSQCIFTSFVTYSTLLIVIIIFLVVFGLSGLPDVKLFLGIILYWQVVGCVFLILIPIAIGIDNIVMKHFIKDNDKRETFKTASYANFILLGFWGISSLLAILLRFIID